MDVSPIVIKKGSDVEKESIPDRVKSSKKKQDEDDVQISSAENASTEDTFQLPCDEEDSDHDGVKFDSAEKESVKKVNERTKYAYLYCLDLLG